MSAATRHESGPTNGVRGRAETPARTLRGIGLVRAVAALAIGAYVLADQPASVPTLARASAAYWIVDGLVTFRASRLASLLGHGRLIFLLRAGIAIGAGLIVLGLPLHVVFGAWQPGRGLLFIPVAAVMFAAVGCQIGAAAFDVLICLAMRRRHMSPWSWAVGGTLSVVLAIVVASLFAASPAAVGRVAGIAAIAAALGLFITAFSRGESGAAPAIPAHS
jgi:hypothetical protein